MTENGKDIDYKDITVLDAIHMLHSVYDQVKPETIANCFRQTGLTCHASAYRPAA